MNESGVCYEVYAKSVKAGLAIARRRRPLRAALSTGSSGTIRKSLAHGTE
jgi:hypothetical protein